MEIRDIRPSELEQARRLLLDNNWGPRAEDPARFGFARAFYEKIGFVASTFAMERLRKKPA